MLVFKACRQTNYSIEALNLLAQYHFFMSQKKHFSSYGLMEVMYMVFLLIIFLAIYTCIWSTSTGFKEAVRTLVSKKTPLAIKHAANCVGVLDTLLDETYA